MKRLNELEPGQVGRVVEMGLQDRTGSRLREMGLIKGMKIERLRVAPFGDPIQYYACGYRLALRQAEARHVHIEIVEPE